MQGLPVTMATAQLLGSQRCIREYGTLPNCLPFSVDAAWREKRRGPLGCLPTHPALLPDPPLYKRGTIPQAHSEREMMRRAGMEGGHHRCPRPLGDPEAPPPWKMPAFLGALARGPLWEGTAFCPEFPPSPLPASNPPRGLSYNVTTSHPPFKGEPIPPSARPHLSSDIASVRMSLPHTPLESIASCSKACSLQNLGASGERHCAMPHKALAPGLELAPINVHCVKRMSE